MFMNKMRFIKIQKVETKLEKNVIQGEKEFGEYEQQKQEYFKNKLAFMEKQLTVVRIQEKRYQEIIDVCLINQNQNEFKIRTLNFYLKNLKKILQEKKDLSIENQKSILQIQKDTGEQFRNYENMRIKKEFVLINIKNMFENQKCVESKLNQSKIKSGPRDPGEAD